jgi:hypothetical protein
LRHGADFVTGCFAELAILPGVAIPPSRSFAPCRLRLSLAQERQPSQTACRANLEAARGSCRPPARGICRRHVGFNSSAVSDAPENEPG